MRAADGAVGVGGPQTPERAPPPGLSRGRTQSHQALLPSRQGPGPGDPTWQHHGKEGLGCARLLLSSSPSWDIVTGGAATVAAVCCARGHCLKAHKSMPPDAGACLLSKQRPAHTALLPTAPEPDSCCILHIPLATQVATPSSPLWPHPGCHPVGWPLSQGLPLGCCPCSLPTGSLDCTSGEACN